MQRCFSLEIGLILIDLMHDILPEEDAVPLSVEDVDKLGRSCVGVMVLIKFFKMVSTGNLI